MGWSSHDKLTVADLDLLERIARGQRDKHIARDLHIERPAVTMRVKKVISLIGATSRPHAVAIYLAPEKYRKP